MQEFLDGLRNQVNERLNSPMIGAYAFSWLFVNYKIPLLLLSDLSVHEKISQVDTLMHGSVAAASVCYGVPLAASLVYLFVLPFPSRFVLWFTLWQQGKVLDLKQRILKQRVIPFTDHEQKMQEWDSSREMLERRLYEADERIKSLRSARDQAETDLVDLTKRVGELSEFQEQAAILNTTNARLQKELMTTAGQLSTSERTVKHYEDVQDRDREIILSALRNLSDDNVRTEVADALRRAIPADVDISDWIYHLPNNLKPMPTQMISFDEG